MGERRSKDIGIHSESSSGQIVKIGMIYVEIRRCKDLLDVRKKRQAVFQHLTHLWVWTQGRGRAEIFVVQFR